jgi:hypothetical protein
MGYTIPFLRGESGEKAFFGGSFRVFSLNHLPLDEVSSHGISLEVHFPGDYVNEFAPDLPFKMKEEILKRTRSLKGGGLRRG